MRAWALTLALITLMVVAFFLLPIGKFGPERPTLSWTAFIVALSVIAGVLLMEIRAVLWEREDSRPGLVIPVLLVLTILVFATAYLALSKDVGEMSGLVTRLDALYFTLVTSATVGYGDITPVGQTARAIAILQILYTFVFVSAAVSAFSQRIRQAMHRRHENGAAR